MCLLRIAGDDRPSSGAAGVVVAGAVVLLSLLGMV